MISLTWNEERFEHCAKTTWEKLFALPLVALALYIIAEIVGNTRPPSIDEVSHAFLGLWKGIVRTIAACVSIGMLYAAARVLLYSRTVIADASLRTVTHRTGFWPFRRSRDVSFDDFRHVRITRERWGAIGATPHAFAISLEGLGFSIEIAPIYSDGASHGMTLARMMNLPSSGLESSNDMELAQTA